MQPKNAHVNFKIIFIVRTDVAGEVRVHPKFFLVERRVILRNFTMANSLNKNTLTINKNICIIHIEQLIINITR